MQIFYVYVFADSSLKRERVFKLIDQARRLIDLLGRPGMEAKGGQTNKNFRKNGFLKFAFRTRERARQYQKLVKDFASCRVSTRRTRTK